MIKHFFKLVWNRRRANGLILVELLCSFLVLCGVLAGVVYNLDQWRRPLGFDYKDVWSLRLDPGPYGILTDDAKRAVHDRVAQLKLELRGLPEIEQMSAYSYNTPFCYNTSAYLNYVRGMRERIEINNVDPEAKDVLGLEMYAGRWLEAGDGDLNWTPVVISLNYAEVLFGNEDPVGRVLPVYQMDGTIEEAGEGDSERRIVGIIRNIRRSGECSPAPLSEFQALPTTVKEVEGLYPPAALLIKVRPGTTAGFEETLLRRGHDVAPEWRFEVTVLEEARRAVLKDRWLPLLGSGVVAGFLIVMVGMGLVGVLWQTVTRRTRELGLRRALGATGTAVRWQVLGELLALTTLAVALGTLLFLQLPLLHVFSQAGFHVYLIALAIGMMVIYPFVILCGLYPSWLATRVHPVQALQYE
jgi:putative ABC transport system permease protein